MTMKTARRLAACLLLCAAVASPAMGQSIGNSTGTLPGDPNGIEEARAAKSPADLQRFLLDAAWDDRLTLATQCDQEPTSWGLRLENMLQARIKKAILGFAWQNSGARLHETWWAQGALDASQGAILNLAQRYHAGLCGLVLSPANLAWATAAIEHTGPVSYAQAHPTGSVPLPLSTTIGGEEIAETAARCGIRDAAWLGKVRSHWLRNGSAPQPGDIDRTVPLAEQAAFVEGGIAANQKWSEWERVAAPDGGCSSIAPDNSALGYADSIAK